jgi:hypothetical protein
MASLRVRVLRLLATGAPPAEVARRTKAPPRLVRRIAKAEGLLPPPAPKKPRAPRQPKPEKGPPSNRVAGWQYALALSMLKDGATCAAVAEDVGITPRTAARLARAHHIYVRPRGRQRGESGVPLPLRAAALRMVAEGATLAEAGASVGVTRQAVHQWAKEDGGVFGRTKKTSPAVHREAPALARTGQIEKALEFA